MSEGNKDKPLITLLDVCRAHPPFNVEAPAMGLERSVPAKTPGDDATPVSCTTSCAKRPLRVSSEASSEKV